MYVEGCRAESPRLVEVKRCEVQAQHAALNGRRLPVSSALLHEGLHESAHAVTMLSSSRVMNELSLGADARAARKHVSRTCW
jgi:hypothetical protein